MKAFGNAGKMQLQHSGSIPMQGKSGLGNTERKTLSNITNTMKPLGSGGATSKPSLSLSDAENSSAKTLKKPLSARVPLRNITNENSAFNPSPGNAPFKELKQVCIMSI